MELYHYTCSCWAPKIAAQQLLRGSRHPILVGYRLIWLTDLDTPIARAIGVPTTPCDRLQFRVAVDRDAGTIVRWSHWSRRAVPVSLRQAVEVNDPGALHAHWWLGFGELPILRIDDTRLPLLPKENTSDARPDPT